MRHTFLLLIAITLLGAGCKREVNVQVFIVTKSSENVKLGLVEVRAISYEDLDKALRPVLKEREPILAHIQKEMDSKEEENKKLLRKCIEERPAAETNSANAAAIATKAIQSYNEAITNGLTAARNFLSEAEQRVAAIDILDPRYLDTQSRLSQFRSQLAILDLEFCAASSLRWSEYGLFGKPDEAIEIISRPEWSYLRQHSVAISNAAVELKASCEKAKAAAAEYDRVNGLWHPLDDSEFEERIKDVASPQKLYYALPFAAISAKTDADGRCRLNLSRGKRWFLCATASRSVPAGGTEEYVWIAPVSEKSGSSINVSLSNDNLLHAGADPFGIWNAFANR